MKKEQDRDKELQTELRSIATTHEHSRDRVAKQFDAAGGKALDLKEDALRSLQQLQEQSEHARKMQWERDTLWSK